MINRWSTGRFVPPPVYIGFYIGFPLFVLAKSRSEQFFTVPWRARETVGFRTNRSVGTLFCPASPRPTIDRRAPRRPDPPVVCPGFGLDRCVHLQSVREDLLTVRELPQPVREFPDMPCMKRVYKDK